MILKKIAVLFLILLTAACNSEPEAVLEKGLNILDIYLKVKPIIDAGLTVTPMPAFGNLKTIQAYFTLASSSNCQFIDDNYTSTLQSIQCSDEGTIVKYDNWITNLSANGKIDEQLNSTENTVISEGKWSDDPNSENKLGRYLLYKNKNGQAFLLWTVYGTSFSGWAVREDGDQEALLNWWMNSGGSHN